MKFSNQQTKKKPQLLLLKTSLGKIIRLPNRTIGGEILYGLFKK